MYLKLNPKLALRSWIGIPYAYYMDGKLDAEALPKEAYERLQLCDGMHEIPDDPLTDGLVKHGFCTPCEKDDCPSENSLARFCMNRYFPAVNWAITGKCNYNCLHCFNAADNARSFNEFTWDECQKFLDEAKECGIHAFIITGGEPLLHPNFRDIIRSIYERGMYILEINTNGYLITQQLLDEMKAAGCRAILKISFDGLGHHDYLRNFHGAEERTLEAVKLCKANGFTVYLQMNINHYNLDTLLPTLEMADNLDIEYMRVIRTSESPRWLLNSAKGSLSYEEYYETCLKTAADYIKKPHRMKLIFWQFLELDPEKKQYQCIPESWIPPNANTTRIATCPENRRIISVTPKGNLIPCQQMSGAFENLGIVLGNVKNTTLRLLLLQSPYLDEVTLTVGSLYERNKECNSCQYWAKCLGGCRALAYLTSNDLHGPDKSKCCYYKNDYHTKIDSIFNEWSKRGTNSVA